MKLTKEGIELMHEFEGLRLEAYQDSVGVWTIGWGNTYYEDGTRVKEGDIVTRDRADELYTNIVGIFADRVEELLDVTLSGGQFSALVSFTYNVGIANLRSSTLLKKVNSNPCDPSIYDEFMKWNKAGGRVLRGLTRRREAEAKMYING